MPTAWRKNAARAAAGLNPLYAAGTVFLVVYALVFADSYDQRILAIAGIYALLVIGYQLVFGHAGAISLAQAAFFGLGAYVTALLWNNFGLTPWIGIPLAMLAAAGLAVLIAYPCSRFRITGHYFALLWNNFGLTPRNPP